MTYSDKPLPTSQGIVMSLEGMEKTGKTWLALSSLPEPVVYVNCDRDNSRIINRLRKGGRRILTGEQHLFVPQPADDILRQRDQEAMNAVALRALKPWKAFKVDYLEALADPNVRSVVADSGTRAYLMCRLGRFGKLLEVAPVLYSKTNYEFANLLQIAHASGKVVVWINRIGEEFKPAMDNQGRDISNKTGAMKTLGYREFNFEMDAVVRTSITKSGDFKAVIHREGVGSPDALGMDFSGDDLNMANILAALTRTKKEKWQ